MKKFYYFLSAVCLVVLTVLVIACNKQDAQPICENVDRDSQYGEISAVELTKILISDYEQSTIQRN